VQQDYVGLPEQLTAWIQRQRWYGGKSREPQFELIGSFALPAADDTDIRVNFVLDHAEPPALYQVPVTRRNAKLPGADAALISEDETGYLYDGPHDPAFTKALLTLIMTEQNIEGATAAIGHLDPAGRGLSVVSSKVLGGEQSNTSIIFETRTVHGSAGLPVICKLFRALHDGDNPDVVLTEVLGLAGSAVVPRVVGHVSGHWPDTAKANGIATGHLAFAQEFLPGSEDAWRVALKSAHDNETFTLQAHALGATTAEMHATLARAMPSTAPTPADIATILTSMRERFSIAAHEVTSLAQHGDALERVYQRAASSPWLPLQRIHGDYHLGQVLDAGDRGWVILDFEGEPLRPMNERSVPDSPLRDVAGMLRSFDYVAGSTALTEGIDATDWAVAARHAFVDGYVERSGYDVRAHRAVLDAFEIDKAIYEAIYEARNRPQWLSIPLDAITRLVERVSQT
jgi:maltokinase